MEPRITVVVPCRNERHHIEACLASLLDQEVPGGFEVVVADGLSDDGTRALLGRFAADDDRLRVVDNPDRFVAHGLNRAIAAARGEIIVRADVHTRYAPDFIATSVAVLDETGADVVGGPGLAVGDGLVGEAIAAAFRSHFAVGGAAWHDPEREGPVDTVHLGCWRRSTLEALGGFDEELVRNQDDELNLRIRRRGGTVWLSPRIRSWYTPRASLRQLFAQYRQYGYWKVRVIQKHRLPASMRHLVPGAFVLYVGITGATAIVGLVVFPPAGAAAGTLALAALVPYALASVGASALAARRTRWRLFPILPAVFAAYHFGYGVGFLEGVADFVVRRRASLQAHVELTRSY